jgi:CRP-like cAMP-binding protein
MQPEARSGQREAVQAHPLAELLACPAATGSLLNGSTRCIDLQAGDVVFRQSGACLGLYVIVSGRFVRRTERMETRLTLGPVRPGDLVELAAALGNGQHTYTLSAQAAGSVLLLPIEALNQAFQSYPPLRMKLLEELAREVSRAYYACCMQCGVKTRRHAGGTAQA